jgi:hypothetical protein
MALVKDPFGAREARGSVGGITASRNRSGAYFRSKASPVQPRSSAQQARRVTLQFLNRQFLDLTPSQQSAWNDFAQTWTKPNVFGDATLRTGLNWFVAFNSRLNAVGVSISTTPPLNPEPVFSAAVSIFQHVSTGNIMATFTSSMPANNWLWLQWSGNLPTSSQFKKKSLKQRKILSGPQSGTVTLIAYNQLSPDDSLRQIEYFGVDSAGRGTPRSRVTIYPVTV